jgi:N-6 DNA Methylase
MPEAFTPGARRTGVELDTLTARIAQRLYPDATIFAKGFEETSLPDNFFDAVVSNIPFGNYPVFDPAYRSRPAVTRAIRDYFFAKALDKARAGGIVALITSRYTMDKQDTTIRKYLAERANLLGAIRLPNTAFKANAGTEVTTDIVFLQKHGQGGPASAEAWRELAPIETPDGPILVNEYFARHPEMMLGQMRLEHGMYRGGEASLAGELSQATLGRNLPIRTAIRSSAVPSNEFTALGKRLGTPAPPSLYSATCPRQTPRDSMRKPARFRFMARCANGS